MLVEAILSKQFSRKRNEKKRAPLLTLVRTLELLTVLKLSSHIPLRHVTPPNMQAGSDPDLCDKVSNEAAFDVSDNEDTRALLQGWDRCRTEKLIETRRRTMLAKMEERIKTSAEREQYAKQQLRQELVQKAEAGDVDGIKVSYILSVTAPCPCPCPPVFNT